MKAKAGDEVAAGEMFSLTSHTVRLFLLPRVLCALFPLVFCKMDSTGATENPEKDVDDNAGGMGWSKMAMKDGGPPLRLASVSFC